MSTRDELINALTGWLSGDVELPEKHRPEAAAMLDAYRTEVLREAHESASATDLAAADNPTQLRWGLNDVLWGDDDTVTVLLSGPAGEPYWLELDSDRAAVLREDLCGPNSASVREQGDEAADDLMGVIREAIVDFNFGDYGLDEVDPQSEYAEWVGDLASAIAGALPARKQGEEADR